VTNLFRFACIIALSLVLAVPALADSSLDKQAEHAGYSYLKKMVIVCNDFSYLKSTDRIERYKGKIRISLHEPPSKDPKKSIEWEGGYEVNAPDDRMNFKNEGWTEPPVPLLFFVQKRRGQWQASGFLNVSCDEVKRLKR
jgi:hypothetical protein